MFGKRKKVREAKRESGRKKKRNEKDKKITAKSCILRQSKD